MRPGARMCQCRACRPGLPETKKAGRVPRRVPAFSPAALPTPSLAKRFPLSDELFLILLRLGHRLAAGRQYRRNRRHGRFEHLAVAATRLRRLEGAPGMELAVGQAGNLLLAAEVEIRLLRIADRPAAAGLRQRLDVFALVAAGSRAPRPAACRARCRPDRAGAAPGCRYWRSAASSGAVAACARARGRCDFMREVVARPDRPEAVHLADYGIAGHARRAGRRSGWRSDRRTRASSRARHARRSRPCPGSPDMLDGGIRR